MTLFTVARQFLGSPVSVVIYCNYSGHDPTQHDDHDVDDVSSKERPTNIYRQRIGIQLRHFRNPQQKAI